MSNTVKFGASNAVVAFEGDDGFETPISIPGLVNIALDIEGDELEFYADNGKYFVYSKNNGYKGTVETAMFPDAVLQRALGWYTDVSGNIVEDADGKQASFAFGFQIDGDQNNRATWFYKCQLSRPSINASTTEASLTPATDTVNITISPYSFVDTGTGSTKKIVKLVCPDLSAQSTFLDEVVIPGNMLTATYTEVVPTGDEVPVFEGWYVNIGQRPTPGGGTVSTDYYVLTDDTTVDQSKTYYTKD